MNEHYFNVLTSIILMAACVLLFISEIKSQSYGFAIWWAIVYTVSVANAITQFWIGLYDEMENSDE